MSSKNVRFEASTSKGGSRSSRHERDSGVGSSSSEQASTGGKPDRKFTAQDREQQRNNITAVREALDSALQDIQLLKAKNKDLEVKAREAWNAKHEAENARRDYHDANVALEHDNEALRNQYDGLRQDYDNLAAENAELRTNLFSQPSSGPPLMSGAVPAQSSTIKRTKSKRESGKDKDQTERLRERINKTSPEAESSSKGSKPSRHRRPSVSIATSSSSKPKPYIEEPPAHYVTTSAPYTSTMTSRADSSYKSHVPRTASSSHGSHDHYVQESGDYIPYPLPDVGDKGKNRRSR